MYSHASPAPTASRVAAPKDQTEIEPLDRERFEHLTEDEAVSLLASRTRSFIERGWGWRDALLLAVRPDPWGPSSVPRPGDVSRA
jgi:hypothetical protein